jgi:hypothetical protein
MSTDHILEALEVCVPPKLVRFMPVFHGSERERRRLSLTPDIHDWLIRPVSSEFVTQLKAATKVHFGQFVKGEEIDDCEFMKRTSNMSRGHNDFTRGIWHIRPDFIPRYRFFGAFFRADWFVVFTKKERNAINTNQRWLKEIDVACRSWDALLPHNKPHSGNELSEYVTFNAEHCDDRW